MVTEPTTTATRVSSGYYYTLSGNRWFEMVLKPEE